MAKKRRASSRSSGANRCASSRAVDSARELLNASAGATQAVTRPATPNVARPRRYTTNGRINRFNPTPIRKAAAFHAEFPNRRKLLFGSAISAIRPLFARIHRHLRTFESDRSLRSADHS